MGKTDDAGAKGYRCLRGRHGNRWPKRRLGARTELVRLALAVGLGMVLATASGCSLKQITVDQTAAILRDASTAYENETDLELAAAALPATLKTIEGFLAAHPTQPTLLALLAEGYVNYAFGFVEDEAEALEASNYERAAVLKKRATALYWRARDFGFRLLAQRAPELVAALRADTMPSKAVLAALDPDDVAGLFWVTSPWANAINLNKHQPAVLAQVYIVKALAARCAELDEAYFHGGPRLVQGALEAALPAALGGRKDLAREHFDRAVALSDGRFLITRVMMARLAAVQAGDRAWFEQVLREVLAADPDALPRGALANRVAQRKARRYLGLVDEWFL